MSRNRPNLKRLKDKAGQSAQAISQNEAQRAPTRFIPVTDIRPSPFQARLDFTSLDSLIEDIQNNGVLQPILVRPLRDNQYEIVAGERRWRASKAANKSHIPAVIRPMTNQEARMFGLRENLQREDLNAYELAKAILNLVAYEVQRSPAQVQSELGRSEIPEDTQAALEEALQLIGRELTVRSYQKNYLALLRLSPDLIKAIEQGASYSAVLALRPATLQQRALWLPKIISGEWSRRQVQAALKEAAIQGPNTSGGKTSYEWDKQWTELRRSFSPKKLSQLDTRKQQKAQKLIQQLQALLNE